jgi:hypothetical protein
MARKSRIASAASSSKPSKRGRTRIPEAFRIVSSATVKNSAAGADAPDVEVPAVEVPILVLCGDWLKAIGFPIGSAAYLTTDAQGDLTLHRTGLRMPRRLYIRKAPG